MFDEDTVEKLIKISIVVGVLLGINFLLDHWLHNPLTFATSTSRDDTGAGACETIFVKEIKIH